MPSVSRKDYWDDNRQPARLSRRMSTEHGESCVSFFFRQSGNWQPSRSGCAPVHAAMILPSHFSANMPVPIPMFFNAELGTIIQLWKSYTASCVAESIKVYGSISDNGFFKQIP